MDSGLPLPSLALGHFLSGQAWASLLTGSGDGCRTGSATQLGEGDHGGVGGSVAEGKGREASRGSARAEGPREAC